MASNKSKSQSVFYLIELKLFGCVISLINYHQWSCAKIGPDTISDKVSCLWPKFDYNTDCLLEFGSKSDGLLEFGSKSDWLLEFGSKSD